MIENKQGAEFFMKFFQFFFGLAIGLLSLYYTSTQWHQAHTETLFELKELRREYSKIEENLSTLTALANKHEKDNVKSETKLEMLEVRVAILEKYANEKKKQLLK